MDIEPSDPTPGAATARTHKICGDCGASSVMMALACQTCGVQFTTTGRSHLAARFIRGGSRAPVRAAHPDDEIILLDDPITDELIARLGSAMTANDAG